MSTALQELLDPSDVTTDAHDLERALLALALRQISNPAFPLDAF